MKSFCPSTLSLAFRLNAFTDKFAKRMKRLSIILIVFLAFVPLHLSAQVTANFSANILEGCAPLTVQFNDNSTGNIVSYSWNFGGGLTSSDPNPLMTFTTPGVYTVSLNVSDGNSSDIELKVNYITVLENPDANFIAPLTSGCPPLDVSFINISTGANSYIWDFGDGTLSTSPSPTHTYTMPGRYTVTLAAISGTTGAQGTVCIDTLIQDTIIEVFPVPSADFTAFPVAPIQSCQAPTFVSFFDISSGGVSSWDWDLGDGSSSNASSPSYSYGAPGTYDVTLTVTNAEGCSDAETKASYVEITEPAAAFGASTQSGCVPLTVTFTDSSTSNIDLISNWVWDFGDGTIVTGTPSPTHTYSTPGLYDVSLVIQTQSGCRDTVLYDDFVGVGEPRTIVDFISNPPLSCAIDPINFLNLSFPTMNTNFFWDFGDGGTSTQPSPSYFYQDTGVFDVTLIADNFGCRDTITKMDVVTIIEPVARFSITPSISCNAPVTVTFNDESIVPTSWLWDFGDGGTSTLQNPTHTYTNPGQYTVLLTVDNNQTGCSDDFELVFEIRDPLADFSASLTSACIGTEISFSNLSSNADAFFWSFGDGNTSTLSNPTHIYTTPGIYDVELIMYEPTGCSDTLRRTSYITIGDLNLDFSFTLSDTCVPLVADFTDLSTAFPGDSSINSWLWDFGDGGSAATPNPVHTYVVEGDYTVSLTVTTDQGCVDTLVFVDTISACEGELGAPFSCDSLLSCSIGSLGDVDIATVDTGDVLVWDGLQFVPTTPDIDDADADPANEYNASVALTGTQLEVSDGGGTLSVDLSPLQDGVDDADSDPANEYNSTFSLTGTQLDLSDGGGTLSVDLSALSGGATVWNSAGGNAYYTTGNVGVGTMNPAAKLQVEDTNLGDEPALFINGADNQSPAGYSFYVRGHPSGAASAQHVQLTTGVSDARMTLKCADATDFAPRLQMTGPTDAANPGWAIFDYGSRLEDLQDASFKMRFMPTSGAPVDMIHADGRTAVYLVPTEGRVGVGTNAPAELLHVAGRIRSDELLGGGNIIADANGNLILGGSVSNDNDSTNEIQSLALVGNQLSISAGNTITLNTDDADASPSNELLSNVALIGTQLEITDAGGTYAVDLSGLGGGSTSDNDWAFASGTTLNDPIYHLGNVGIGTNTPSAKLAVQNGSVLFAGNTGTTPIAGAGTRMMWVPEKAAFRAGGVMGNEWDHGNIGNFSTAIGQSSIASGMASTAIGRDHDVSGIGATAIGRNNLVTGDGATAIGRDNEAAGEGSSALGFSTNATGYAAISMGLSTTASGDYSFAGGSLTTASGFNTVALGLNTQATGNYATSMGASTEAQGAFSFAMGDGSIAAGSASMAMGVSTQSSYASLALGRYNDDTGSSSVWNAADYVFTIGDGTSASNRSNAMYVQKNGDVWIQGNLSQFSDERLKKHIDPIEGALESITQLNGVRYDWKNQEQMGTDRQLGVIAQEIEVVYPELITEVEGYKAVNYIGLVPVLIEAVKTQQQMIDNQGNNMDKLNQTVTNQNAIIANLQAELEELKQLVGASSVGTNAPQAAFLASSDNSQIGEEAKLFQNKPNPFQDQTDLPYYLPEGSVDAQIVVYDVIGGRTIATYMLTQTGYGKISLTAQDLPSGVYLYTLFIGNQKVDSKRMVLVD